MKKAILLLLILSAPASPAREIVNPNQHWRTELYKVAFQSGFSPWILMGIASRESDFRHSLVGDGGNSFSGFQIHQKWFPGYQNASIQRSAHFVVDYLRKSLREGLSINAAIASYNAGRAGVRRQRGQDYDKATTGKNYAADVLRRARHFALRYGHEVETLPTGGGHDRENPLFAWSPCRNRP